MLHVRGKDLEACVLPEMRQEYERRKYEIFENLSHHSTQAGLLKLEGIYRAGYFRWVINYFMSTLYCFRLLELLKRIVWWDCKTRSVLIDIEEFQRRVETNLKTII
jgi:hypothetical protein